MKFNLFRGVNLASSLAGTVIRAGNGISTEPATIKPEKLLKLYDIESCPYCRLVREALTELDIDAEIYPCPKEGERFRPQALRIGGKAQFPLLVDENHDVVMYESMDIIRYLFKTYGDRDLPLKWRASILQTTGSMLTSATRFGAGERKKSSHQPEHLLELFSFESSPFARLVRETLCELEIPYIVRNCGRTELAEWMLPSVRNVLGIKPQSVLPNRIRLQQETGRMAIPYLIDPNHDVAMFESTDIVNYLYDTYSDK